MCDVSIVTCTFNQEARLLKECADSVRSQTREVHWIVVDDGSSPHFGRILESVVQSDRTAQTTSLIRLPANRGLSTARNAGLERVDTEWTIVLDSDDRLVPTIADDICRLPSDKALACFEVNYFSDSTNQHRPVRRFEGLYEKFGQSELDPFLWFDFYYHGIIARTSLLRSIGGFTSSLPVGEDQDILLRATERIPVAAVAFVNRVGYEYRVNPRGVCASRWPEVKENYCHTMLQAAQRRNAPFSGCRHAGSLKIDGADIDQYEYRYAETWVNWRSWGASRGLIADGESSLD